MDAQTLPDSSPSSVLDDDSPGLMATATSTSEMIEDNISLIESNHPASEIAKANLSERENNTGYAQTSGADAANESTTRESPSNSEDDTPLIRPSPLLGETITPQAGEIDEADELTQSSTADANRIVETKSNALTTDNHTDPGIAESKRFPNNENGFPVDSKHRHYVMYGVTYAVTALVVSTTVSFAFISSSESHPVTILSTPDKTILAFNVASTLSALLINELLLNANDILRWAMATRPNGVGFATFLVLGRATTFPSTFSLFLSNQKVGQRKWCVQR